MKAALDGILFLRGDCGITKAELQEILKINEQTLAALIIELKKTCQSEEKGIKLVEHGDILKYVTKEEHAAIYERLVENEITKPLTQTALEVLAIVAYNQPITRLEIDEIRGVSSTHLIRRLLLKDLIYEEKRSAAPGRPIIYRTTSQFLDVLGLKDLDELPVIDSEENAKEIELFAKKVNEN